MQCKEIQSSGTMKEILSKKRKSNKKETNREERERERNKSQNRRRTVRVMNILTMDSMLRLNLNDIRILAVYQDGVKNISTRPLHRIRCVLLRQKVSTKTRTCIWERAYQLRASKSSPRGEHLSHGLTRLKTLLGSLSRTSATFRWPTAAPRLLIERHRIIATRNLRPTFEHDGSFVFEPRSRSGDTRLGNYSVLFFALMDRWNRLFIIL